jgi:hypothetical protein
LYQPTFSLACEFQSQRRSIEGFSTRAGPIADSGRVAEI